MAKLLRMERDTRLDAQVAPDGVRVERYERNVHHHVICEIYADAFEEPPWPEDWERFSEFDPDGVFVAVDAPTAEPIAFAISFRRNDFGYVSVVAVRRSHQRRGIASALIHMAAGYLSSIGLDRMRIDAYASSAPAVTTYQTLGFRVIEELEE